MDGVTSLAALGIEIQSASITQRPPLHPLRHSVLQHPEAPISKHPSVPLFRFRSWQRQRHTPEEPGMFFIFNGLGFVVPVALRGEACDSGSEILAEIALPTPYLVALEKTPNLFPLVLLFSCPLRQRER